MRPISIALLMLALAGCNLGTEAPPASSSAAPISASSTPAPDAAPPLAASLIKRQSTPAERRKADESACLSGSAGACRHMADRFRGYGHPGGCGIDRSRPMTTIPVSGGSALEVRIKRTTEDSDADERGFLQWIGKACDLGDSEACQIERSDRKIDYLASTTTAEDACLRSDPSKSAFWAWQKATRPKEFPELQKVREKCLSDRYGCAYWLSNLYRRGDMTAPTELAQALREQAEAICATTLDCNGVWMMLDKNGYTPELLAPVRAHAAKVLAGACIEGACVCGDAAREVAPDDPRLPDLARMGCENGEVEGCYALGRLYEEGRGVPRDAFAARSLYDLACPPMRPASWGYGPRQGDYSPRACDRLAEMYEAGAMPPKDVDRARYYAEFACSRPGFERDHAPCIRLARYWASGAVKSGCVAVGEARCASNSEEAEDRFYGPKSAPVSAKECERPSVKALCDRYKQELVAMRK
jgi:TPR repeat protein